MSLKKRRRREREEGMGSGEIRDVITGEEGGECRKELNTTSSSGWCD